MLQSSLITMSWTTFDIRTTTIPRFSSVSTVYIKQKFAHLTLLSTESMSIIMWLKSISNYDYVYNTAHIAITYNTKFWCEYRLQLHVGTRFSTLISNGAAGWELLHMLIWAKVFSRLLFWWDKCACRDAAFSRTFNIHIVTRTESVEILHQ